MHSATSDILTALGLALTLIGAGITARAVILREDDAIAIGLARYTVQTRDEKLRLPMVQNLLASSRGARRGLLFIVGGTALQIIPIAARLFLFAVA